MADYVFLGKDDRNPDDIFVAFGFGVIGQNLPKYVVKGDTKYEHVCTEVLPTIYHGHYAGMKRYRKTCDDILKCKPSDVYWL